MKWIAVVADAALVGAVVVLVPFAWMMRDGMGPGATDSSGIAAVGRWFWTFWAGPIVLALSTAVVALHLMMRRKT